MVNEEKLTDFIPEEKQKILVQARLPVDLVVRVRHRMLKDNLTWRKLLTACLKLYLAQGEKEEENNTEQH
jgi:hypothetical protein